MIVAQCNAKFAKLSRYAPQLVDTEYHKAEKFEWALRQEIYDQVAVFRVRN